MNKKGFTLIELIFVVVLIAIVSLIVVPNVIKILKNNETKKYSEYQNILIENLKLYNLDKKEEIWTGDNTLVEVTYDELQTINQDIDLSHKLEECLPTYLGIQKNNERYKYLVCMSCINGDEIKFYGNTECP